MISPATSGLSFRRSPNHRLKRGCQTTSTPFTLTHIQLSATQLTGTASRPVRTSEPGRALQSEGCRRWWIVTPSRNALRLRPDQEGPPSGHQVRVQARRAVARASALPGRRCRLTASAPGYGDEGRGRPVGRSRGRMEERYRPMVWVAALLGLRRGGVAGLTVTSLDLLGRTITVRQQLDRYGGLVSPKSRAGRRPLSIPRALVEILAAHLQAMGLTAADPDALVFTTPDGHALAYTNWRERVWVPTVDAVGLTCVGMHDLRRTNATVLDRGCRREDGAGPARPFRPPPHSGRLRPGHHRSRSAGGGAAGEEVLPGCSPNLSGD